MVSPVSIPTSLSLNDLSTSEDISCSGVINGFLAYGNQSAITTVGSLTELGINSTATSESKSIMAIEQPQRNATWMGNATNNDLRFGVNNSTSMILTTTGRLGLGYIACTAMAMTSDRRLKRNIQPCPLKRIKRLYDNCDVVLYDWIESENRPGQEVGLIAQDLVSAHLTDLISVFYRDDIQEGEGPSFEPAKTQLNVDYSRIATMPFTFRISKRKDNKYDAVLDDGRVESFGGIKRNGEPYQQYRDSAPLRAFSKYDHGNIERNQRFYKRHGPINFRNHTPLLGSQKNIFGNL
ncbi:unnamed protein product [Phytophthora lilii]|uniref:Unnamed protein product n=1 Tax=Phytophthora lilii TaxID=2077276 RepID=A0A9W6YEZ4_9STRA|nr:unnamed protein product [Phytophthora lilii]